MKRAEQLILTLLLLLYFVLAGCGGAQSGVTGAPELGEEESAGVLEVDFLDVGQGDSILIVTPEDHVVLIDAGPPEAAPAVLAALRDRGIDRVNLVLVTHPHADHIGGLSAVLDSTRVLRYADPGYPHTSSMYANLLEQVQRLGIAAYQLHAGQWIRLDDDIDMRVLGPPSALLSGTRSDANANSLVLLLEYGDVRILFMGDAEEETEQAVLASNLAGDVDVLKVAHHGSAYASTQQFLEVVRPEYAIISCGRDNTYGHPSPETVERLEPFASDGIYRTDQVGTIVLETNGDWIRVHTTASGPQAQWLLELAASE